MSNRTCGEFPTPPTVKVEKRDFHGKPSAIVFSVILLSLALLFFVTTTQAQQDESIQIHHPWVREAPPASQVSAAYLEIENSGEEARVLIHASSPQFQQAEIHTVVMTHGMMRMQRQEQLEIPPGNRVLLKPGGYHIMLLGRLIPLRSGAAVDLTLYFKNGGQKTVRTVVRTAQQKQSLTHDEHHKRH